MYLCTRKQKQTTKTPAATDNSGNKVMANANNYTEDLLIKSEDIQDTNLRRTLCEMVSKLFNAEAFLNEGGYNQVCLQLNKDKDGKQWKMFVYYDNKHESYYFSFQDEDCEDTLFTRGYTFLQMVEQIEREINKVGGFEWIEFTAD